MYHHIEKYMTATILYKWIAGWMILVIFILILCVQNIGNSTFFRIGPHKDLLIFSIAIDTGWKYFCVFFYTMFSTLIRTLQQEVLRPWIIQQIQNDEPKPKEIIDMAYPIVVTETIYIWVDWFMYLNILLAQVDLMIVEMVGNVAMTMFMTRMYILRKNQLTIIH